MQVRAAASPANRFFTKHETRDTAFLNPEYEDTEKSNAQTQQH